jgi:Rod binding domain-containing protein
MIGYDLNGLSSSALTEYAMQESKNASTTALQKKLESTSEHSSDDELWAACKSFESYFLEQVFKEMQKSVDALKPESQDRSTSTLVDYFKDQTLQEVCATSVDKQSNGFAQMLYENLRRTYDIPKVSEDETEKI